jgi:hypothetical protein
MGSPNAPKSLLRNLSRGFEKSRVEGKTIVAAYDLVAPIFRRSLAIAEDEQDTAKANCRRGRQPQCAMEG